MLPFAFLNLFTGTLSDLYYRPRILVYGLILSTLGSILGALSPNILIFSLSRTIQGIGSALLVPVTLALVGDITPRAVMGKAMGVYGVFLGSATTFGPLIGGFFASIDWRLVPLLLSIYSAIGAVLVWVEFRGTSLPQKKTRIVLIFQQLKNILKNRNVILLSLTGFLLFFTFQGIQPFITDLLSLPPFLVKNEELGFLFAIVGFAGILFSYIGGISIDKIGSKKTMALAFLMMLISQFSLIFANSYWSYLILLAVLGAFYRMAGTAIQTLVIESAPEARGSSSSSFNFARFLGFAVAPAIMATTYLVQGISLLYILNIMLLLLGIIFTSSIRMH
jgi:MFS family permease